MISHDLNNDLNNDPPLPHAQETMQVTERPSRPMLCIISILCFLFNLLVLTRINCNVRHCIVKCYQWCWWVGKWRDFAMISVTIQLGGRVVIPQFRRLAVWHPSTFTAGALSSSPSPGSSGSPGLPAESSGRGEWEGWEKGGWIYSRRDTLDSESADMTTFLSHATPEKTYKNVSSHFPSS